MPLLRKLLGFLTTAGTSIAWILTSLASWSVGMGIGFAVWYDLSVGSGIIHTEGPFDFRASDVWGAIILGGIVALFQGMIVLVDHQPVFAIKWIMSTAVGILLGFWFSQFLGEYIIRYASCSYFCFFAFDLPPKWYPNPRMLGITTFNLGGPVAGAILGGMIALCQTFFVKQRFSSKAVWIIANALGLAIAFTLGSVFGGEEILVVGAIVGIVYGIATVRPLGRLLA